jgi:hypothetical protein
LQQGDFFNSPVIAPIVKRITAAGNMLRRSALFAKRMEANEAARYKRVPSTCSTRFYSHLDQVTHLLAMREEIEAFENTNTTREFERLAKETEKDFREKHGLEAMSEVQIRDLAAMCTDEVLQEAGAGGGGERPVLAPPQDAERGNYTPAICERARELLAMRAGLVEAIAQAKASEARPAKGKAPLLDGECPHGRDGRTVG